MSRSGSQDLIRLKAKVLELPAPIGVGITQALDINAAREATLNRGIDELGSKKCERKRQIDMTDRASFTFCQLFGAGD
jgi:hypothetical protein